MKKLLSLMLTLAMLCTGALALAESQTITIDFEGTYFTFEDYGFKILIPDEWYYEDENPDYDLLVYNEDETQAMSVIITDFDGAPLETVAQIIADTEGYEDVTMVTINGIPFVLYNLPADDAMGAFTVTTDEKTIIEFTFAPASDAEFVSLAEQIMVSIEAL